MAVLRTVVPDYQGSRAAPVPEAREDRQPMCVVGDHHDLVVGAVPSPQFVPQHASRDLVAGRDEQDRNQVTHSATSEGVLAEWLYTLLAPAPQKPEITLPTGDGDMFAHPGGLESVHGTTGASSHFTG